MRKIFQRQKIASCQQVIVQFWDDEADYAELCTQGPLHECRSQERKIPCCHLQLDTWFGPSIHHAIRYQQLQQRRRRDGPNSKRPRQHARTAWNHPPQIFSCLQSGKKSTWGGSPLRPSTSISKNELNCIKDTPPLAIEAQPTTVTHIVAGDNDVHRAENQYNKENYLEQEMMDATNLARSRNKISSENDGTAHDAHQFSALSKLCGTRECEEGYSQIS
jgi:hypothetical protein